jgi:hypothetical protein
MVADVVGQRPGWKSERCEWRPRARVSWVRDLRERRTRSRGRWRRLGHRGGAAAEAVAAAVAAVVSAATEWRRWWDGGGRLYRGL